jgi:hypothetical protein
VQSLVDKVEVSGVNEVWLYPSDEAVSRGWGAAFTGEFRCSIGQYGRGERASAALTQRSVRFLMINRTLHARVVAERSA